MRSEPPINRILVAVDSEGLSSQAAVLGFKLAAQMSAKLDLTHAVEVQLPLWPGIGEEQLSALLATTLVHARKQTLESLRPDLAAAGFENEPLDELLEVIPGHSASVILHRADEFDADLIVLGPHAKRSMFDFGSTTRAVLSRTTIPVWTQSEPVTPIRKILVPVDFSEHSRRALDHAHALAMCLDASIELLHCHVPPTFAYPTAADAVPSYVIEEERKTAREKLESWLEEYEWKSVPVESTFAEGLTTSTIVEHTKTADLTVMGTHGRTGLSRFLMGSVAYGVLKQSTCPVLVVPSPKRTWLLGEGQPVQAQTTAPAPTSVIFAL